MHLGAKWEGTRFSSLLVSRRNGHQPALKLWAWESHETGKTVTLISSLAKSRREGSFFLSETRDVRV